MNHFVQRTTQIVLLAFMLNGCSSAPPLPPEPSGKITPVNPSVVYLSELKIGR